MRKTRISLVLIDFAATIRETDDSEHLVLIELQKTWLMTETLRFRQYLGTQYLNKENVIEQKNELEQKRTYGVPIVSIYILRPSFAESMLKFAVWLVNSCKLSQCTLNNFVNYRSPLVKKLQNIAF